MGYQKFDPDKLERLNDPGRFDTMRPDVFWEALDAPLNARVMVEIGAGTGLFAAEFLRRAPEAIVYAADTVDTMVDWMRENRPEASTGRLVPVRSHEGHVPLEDALADVVYMLNLHHELAEPDAIYAEAFRLARPGGRVLVADWAPVETPKGPPQHIRASTRDLRGFLERAGFVDVRIHEDALPWHSLVTGRRPATSADSD